VNKYSRHTTRRRRMGSGSRRVLRESAGILVAGMIVARVSSAQTVVHPWGAGPCPPAGDTLQQLKTPSGTCHTFRNQPHPGIGNVLNINGPLHVVARGCRLILAPDAEVAAALARSLAGT
jgi:hypothetical protein